jgi:hypothetical protein
MNTCTICSELCGASNSQLALTLGPQTSKAVLESSDEFTIIPSLGPLVVGHALVVTNKHRTNICSSLANTSERKQIKSLLGFFAKRFCTHLDDSIFCFEHGAAEQSPVLPCSTSHAHLHILPLKNNIISAIIENCFCVPRVSRSYQEVSGYASQLNSYIFAAVCTSSGEMRNMSIRDATGLQSQFMRRVIADVIRLPGWDWRTNPNVSVLKRTLSLGFRIT